MTELAAFLRRDLRITRTYRAALVGQVAGVLLFLATFGLLSPVVRDDFPERFGTGWLGFVAVGIAVSGVLIAALQSFAAALREGQLDGTLEAMLLAPIPQRRVIALLGAAPLASGVGFGVLGLAAAGVAGAEYRVSPLSLALTSVLSLAAFAALGLAGAAAVLVAKRGNPVAGLIGMAGSLAGGAYVPVDTFPGWLQVLAALNPMAYALEAWRGALLDAAPPNDLLGPLLVLASIAAVGIPAAAWLVGRAVDVARVDGTLAAY